ncbi:uncharacterized protein LOC125457399 isoform X1 [Stegostoma tigrinum]|uniref:uncharacterized protein LOC125457399 isoform X1 n=2 Tax=Stegostoma tigrinum TaxID=3053191 RepID=UPI00202B6630|nr:uncharacterized protein LOC125457399 isoform X1 [Stegostoma tigrinum]
MERYEAAMVLGALGNAIGYHNFCNECNKPGVKLTESDLSREIDIMISEPFRCPAPFDTLMHIATAESLTSERGSVQELCSQAAKRYLITLHRCQKCHPKIVSDGAQVQTKNYASKGYTSFGRKEPKFGAAARTMCIGMCYSKAEQLNDLLQASIECGRMTHSYPAGFLGAFCTALFISYAVQGKPIVQWGWRMMEVMPTAEQYCERKMKHFSDYRENWFSFETRWQFYLQLRKIEKDGCDNAIFPQNYDIEEQNKLYRRWRSESSGLNKGLEATLIAYDALLFAGNDWRKLCYSAMFHWGESDATGAIAGSLYGILYGFDNVPTSLYQNLELRSHLEQLGRQLYQIATADRILCLSADHSQGNESLDVRPIAREFVNKRRSDEINNLINYIAQQEKVKSTNNEDSVRLTNDLVTAQVSRKAKAHKTEEKLRPTKFQLLQSRFTKIGFRSKLEKLQPPEPKAVAVLEQSNSTADSQSTATNVSTVGKRNTNVTEVHCPTDLKVKEKCELTNNKMEAGVFERPIAESNIETLSPATAQAYVTTSKFPTMDSRHTNFTEMQTFDLKVQQKCELSVGKVKLATLRQSDAENNTTAFCPNTLHPAGMQTLLAKKSNDTCSDTTKKTEDHIQQDSQIKNKEGILNEPVLQMVTEVLYPTTQFQTGDETKNKSTKSPRTSSDVNENGVQTVNFAENINHIFSLGEVVTNSSLCISKLSLSDTTTIHETNSLIPKYTPLGDNKKPNIINPPHTVTNARLHSPIPCIEVSSSMKSSRKENLTETRKENIKQTRKLPPTNMQALKEFSKKSEPIFTTEIVTLPYNETDQAKQYEDQNKQMPNLSNGMIFAVKQHNLMLKEEPSQILKENAEKPILQTKNFKPFISLSQKQTVEGVQKSETTVSPKILMLPDNELQELKEDDAQNKHNLNNSRDLVSTTNQFITVLQKQPQQIQKGNTEKIVSLQTRRSQSFTNLCKKQKLKRIPQKSESDIVPKTHILSENKSKDKKHDDNQHKHIPDKFNDSVNSAVQEEQSQEILKEVAETTTILQTKRPESFIDSNEKQELKEVQQKLQSVITAEILTVSFNDLHEIKDDYQHKDLNDQCRDSIHVAKQGVLKEYLPAVEQATKTESTSSAQNNYPGDTSYNKSKPWKYKAYSYADPSVVSQYNRRVFVKATDAIQFSSPQTSFEFP